MCEIGNTWTVGEHDAQVIGANPGTPDSKIMPENVLIPEA